MSATPRSYDDGFRGAIAMLISTPIGVGVGAAAWALQAGFSPAALPWSIFLALCVMLSGFFLTYLLWTHRLYARSDPARLLEIAAQQHRSSPSALARAFGMGRTSDWVTSAAGGAIVVALVATTIEPPGLALLLPLLVIATAGSAWACVVYAFALRYLRLHAAGETIDFDIDSEPEFIDFVSMAVMMSSIGAMSAGTPRTRAALDAARTHTLVAFAFNALVIAMVVSLVSGFVAAG